MMLNIPSFQSTLANFKLWWFGMRGYAWFRWALHWWGVFGAVKVFDKETARCRCATWAPSEANQWPLVHRQFAAETNTSTLPTSASKRGATALFAMCQNVFPTANLVIKKATRFFASLQDEVFVGILPFYFNPFAIRWEWSSGGDLRPASPN